MPCHCQVDVGHRCLALMDSNTNHQICTHHEDGQPAQVCFRDSRGPLIMDEGGYGVVIGVASYIQLPKCPQGDWKCIMDGKCDKFCENSNTILVAFSIHNIFDLQN